MVRFYSALFILTVFIWGAIREGVHKAFFNAPTFAVEIVLILSFFTGLIYFKLNKIRAQDFTQAYLLSIVLKLLLGGILISLILFMDQNGAVENAIVFIVSYLLFTALEVFFLFQKRKANSKN